jgi:hypothetical protein
MITIRTPLAARSLSYNHAEGVVRTPVTALAIVANHAEGTEMTYVGGMAGWIHKREPSAMSVAWLAGFPARPPLAPHLSPVPLAPHLSPATRSPARPPPIT